MNESMCPETESLLKRQRDLILAATGDGLYGIDRHSNTTFVNPAATRMCGYTLGEMMGAKLHDLIHHTHLDGSHYHVHDCPIYSAANDGKIHRVSDEVFWRKDGSSFPVEYVSTPIWDNGKLVGAVVSFRDITESKLAEEQAAQLQAELHHVSRIGVMGEMATAMAHELNQPISAVMNYISASQKILSAGNEGATEKASQYMSKALSQANRAGEIIRDLRSFVDKDEVNRSFENLNQIIRDAILLTVPSSVRENIRFETQLSCSLPETLVYRVKIQQVVVNLVKNAIEAMSGQTDAHLSVRTTLTEVDTIELSVTDNGPGLTEDQLKNIFKSFVTTKEQGMGMGLSICRSIIEDHEGCLWVENNELQGAQFTFSIPIISRTISEEDTSHE